MQLESKRNISSEKKQRIFFFMKSEKFHFRLIYITSNPLHNLGMIIKARTHYSCSSNELQQ